MNEKTDQLESRIESLEEKCELLMWAIVNGVSFNNEEDDYGRLYGAKTKDGRITNNFLTDPFDVLVNLRGY